MKHCKDQQCKNFGKMLHRSAFPRNRQSEDGRYIYCKECCRRKSRELRAIKGARQNRRRELGLERKPVVRSGFAFSLVYEAIKAGKTTREQIQRETRLSFDDIGEALTELVFQCKAVRIEKREFHLAA